MKKYILDILGLDKESRKEIFTLDTLKIFIFFLSIVIITGLIEGI